MLYKVLTEECWRSIIQVAESSKDRSYTGQWIGNNGIYSLKGFPHLPRQGENPNRLLWIGRLI